MSEEKARNVGPAGIDIAYERFGEPHDPPVLLLMGGGAQMISWPEGFIADLAARGLQPIRFDNRDVGRSTHMADAPPPDLTAALARDLSSASYTLSGMAADTVGLLDALGLASAHLAGASLGGMIAQTVAIEYPDTACAGCIGGRREPGLAVRRAARARRCDRWGRCEQRGERPWCLTGVDHDPVALAGS